jgi:thiamine kinase-like enzyme
MLDEPQCIVTVFVEGEGLDAGDLRQQPMLTDVARSLRAIHDRGEALPTSFDSFRVVETYAATARERGAPPPPAYEEALGHARAIEAALSGPEHDPVPCHNDLLAGNFLRGSERIWIVDWEYAGMGDRYFDLANFAINNEFSESRHAELLADYFSEEASARRLATLRLMLFMSDYREAMWGVVQTVASDLDFDFKDYAATHFERMRKTAANESFDGWLDEARADGPEG